ncbi:MAG: 50S ribosomal protein L18 [Actinobacteria bacterium]|nr:MAG: 50S ribosomal protein L18 [Actinomycetota bacterium]
MDAQHRLQARRRRQMRVRRKIRGTAERPRVAVFRSNRHIYAQLIDDDAGATLAAASSLETDAKSDGAKRDAAKKVGELLGKRAVERGVKTAVLDRGGRLYHGRVQQLADGARESGLTF